MKTGVELITEERARQTKELGYTPEMDDKHDAGTLAIVAAAVVCDGTGYSVVDCGGLKAGAWNILNRHGENGDDPNRIHLLAVAGALIAAEIDRLQRLTALQEGT